MTDLPEPCPDCIIFDTGHLFIIGAVGGTAFHFPKGLYNSSTGARFIGGAKAVHMNVPRVTGRFALWGGLFSTLDCTLAYVRQKRDPWNPMLAVAAASGLVSMRKGVGPMARAAICGAAVLTFLAWVDFKYERFKSAERQWWLVTSEEVPQMEEKAPQTGPRSWFRGLLGEKDQPRKF